MRLHEIGKIDEQALNDIQIHLVTVHADRPAASYVSVAVYEVIYETAIYFAAGHDVALIDCSGFSE